MESICYTAIMDGGTKQRKDKDLGPEFNSEDQSLTVLEVANIRLYHEAIIKRADENHLRTFKKSFEFIGGPFYKVKSIMTNMTKNFEKLYSLIGDTTNMSYEEYVEKMFKASIKINSKSEKVDLKELIDMKEVAEQLTIEGAINKSIEKATGRKFDGFSIKNGLRFNEIDSLSNAANYILENENNNGKDLKVGVEYNVEFYATATLSSTSAFNDGVGYTKCHAKMKFNSREEIRDIIRFFKTKKLLPDYYFMAIEFNPVDEYDNEGNLNKTVRIVSDQEAMIKGFAITNKKLLKYKVVELVKMCRSLIKSK